MALVLRRSWGALRRFSADESHQNALEQALSSKSSKKSLKLPGALSGSDNSGDAAPKQSAAGTSPLENLMQKGKPTTTRSLKDLIATQAPLEKYLLVVGWILMHGRPKSAAPPSVAQPPPRRKTVQPFDFVKGEALDIFEPVQQQQVADWNTVVNNLFAEKSLVDELSSPLNRLDICASVVKPVEKSPEEIIKEHSDFSELISKLNLKGDLNKYVVSVVAPRLGRLPNISAERKRELLSKLAKKLSE